MTARPTRDVSHLYGQSQAGTGFGAGTGYGGDVLLLANPASIDRGRLELHQRVEAEMAASGDSDYGRVLDRVVEQARHGIVQLSQSAREGLGLAEATVPPQRGPVGVHALAQAQGELPAAPETSATFADAVAYCDGRLHAPALLRRTDPAQSKRLIDRALSQGGVDA